MERACSPPIISESAVAGATVGCPVVNTAWQKLQVTDPSAPTLGSTALQFGHFHSDVSAPCPGLPAGWEGFTDVEPVGREEGAGELTGPLADLRSLGEE